MTIINSISGSVLSRSFTTDATNSTIVSQASRPQSSPPSGGGIMSAVQEALSQMGLSLDVPTETSGADSSGSTSSTDPADASIAQKALYKFLHDLFSAMQDQASGTSSSRAYSPPMTTSIQDIILALASTTTSSSSSTSDSGTASTQISGLSNLQSDFQSLVTAMGEDPASGATSTDLQTFLQNLERNLKQQGSLSINFINTTA